MRNIDVEKVTEYASEDADITLQLKNVFEPKLKETGTWKLFEETEMPLVPILASMESEGIKLDVEALIEFSSQLEKEIGIIQTKIFGLADMEFNIASPKQLGEVLFEKLAISERQKKQKQDNIKLVKRFL